MHRTPSGTESEKNRVENGDNEDYMTMVVSILIDLDVGDRVWVESENELYGTDNYRAITFSGRILKAY